MASDMDKATRLSALALAVEANKGLRPSGAGSSYTPKQTAGIHISVAREFLEFINEEPEPEPKPEADENG
ncbi:hypothetical protein SEA_BIG4_48 [Microbacterium phage Big4]|nr:hypothetical protein SEA_BIG4_48 [Microbacterium phage Big4]